MFTATLLLSVLSSVRAVDIPVSGAGTDLFRPLDDRFSGWMERNQIPGGTLVISFRGKLIHARGFGYADVEKGIRFQPTTVFRYGSTAKWMTAMAYMRLVEMGKLKLDSSVGESKALDDVLPVENRDSRWGKLTFRQLLSHKSGLRFQGKYSGEWPFANDGTALPFKERVTFGASKGFETDPGKQFTYANFNFALAGYMFPKLAGDSLDNFLQREIFKRAGVTGISPNGRRQQERLANETQYYVIGGKDRKSIWPEDNGALVPPAYNVDCRVEEGYGGYRGSALSLVRLMSQFAHDGPNPPLTLNSVKEMIGFEHLQKPPATFEGLALGSGSDFKDGYWWGTGGMTPGMTTTVTRRADSLVYVFAFNSNDDLNPNNTELNGIVLKTLDEIREKPSVDFWARFG